MGRLTKFIRLPSTDRGLLVNSALLVVGVRLGLWLLPFQTLRSLLERVARNTHNLAKFRSVRAVERVVWAVTLTSRYVPAATCLTQALALRVLLAKSGHFSELRIGVAKSDNGEFEAHAWLESNGEIVLGKLADLHRYAQLPSLPNDNR